MNIPQTVCRSGGGRHSIRPSDRIAKCRRRHTGSEDRDNPTAVWVMFRAVPETGWIARPVAARRLTADAEHNLAGNSDLKLANETIVFFVSCRVLGSGKLLKTTRCGKEIRWENS